MAHCGIATFTTHLTEALIERLPGTDGFVVAMNDGGHSRLRDGTIPADAARHAR